MNKVELLAPAGDFERLKCAVNFGADAVYLAGTMFGMRTAPANFTYEMLEEAVAFAHEKGVKVYLTVNTLPRNSDLIHLPTFLERANASEVDAFIISDIGVLEAARQYAPGVDIHVSTQHGVVNYLSANSFYRMGANRIITARELSLEEISEIRRNIPDDMDIEAFVHGAMCVSFSGRCLLSNYMVGRDSNRGDCAQPCRWKYSLVEETRPGQYFPVREDESGTYLFNSKDMCMIEHIPELINAGITSFKIEGRAKSEHYVSVITNAYRMAIDGYYENPRSDYKPEQWIIDEVYKVSFRDYCTGFYFGNVTDDANISYKGGYNRVWDVVAVVDECRDGRIYCTQRNRFFEGDEVEVMEKGKKPVTLIVKDLQNEDGETIESVNHAAMKFSFEGDYFFSPSAIVRQIREEDKRIVTQ